MKGLIYLASPYSHPDPAVRHARFVAVCHAAALMMEAGDLIFSPIAHAHPIAEAGKLPKDWHYWQRYDKAILRGCSMLRVLMLDGWSESKGINGEVAIATRLGLPIECVSP